MSHNSNTSFFDRALSRTKSFFSFSVKDELKEFEQEATAQQSNDHMIIDMSGNNPNAATPLNNVAPNNIDSTATAAAPNNDNNVSSARNTLANYYAALLNGTLAATTTATLATATSPKEPVAATNSVANNNATAVPAVHAKRNGFASAWGSFIISSPSASDDFWYYDKESKSEDEDLTWDEVFNTYEFSILYSGEEMEIEKKSRKRNASSL